MTFHKRGSVLFCFFRKLVFPLNVGCVRRCVVFCSDGFLCVDAAHSGTAPLTLVMEGRGSDTRLHVGRRRPPAPRLVALEWLLQIACLHEPAARACSAAIVFFVAALRLSSRRRTRARCP